VRILDSPQPLYLIGDCHVDALHGARVLDEQQNTVAFGTKFHISGFSASEFLDSSGRINPKIVTALVGFQSLRLGTDWVNDPMIDESLLAPNIFAKSFRINSHAANDPVLFSVGDYDARNILYAIPSEADIALTFEPNLLANIPTFTPTKLIPGKSFQEGVLQLLRPLFVGLRHLQKIGFRNIALHSISPPTVDDEISFKTLGSVSRALTRYKVRLLVNQFYASFCESNNIHFIDRWNDLTDEGGRVLPDCLMSDGLHVHYEYVRPSLAKLYECMRASEPAGYSP
jgi:hypothetical protein